LPSFQAGSLPESTDGAITTDSIADKTEVISPDKAVMADFIATDRSEMLVAATNSFLFWRVFLGIDNFLLYHEVQIFSQIWYTMI
jgi:hypothetical protein